MPDECLERVFCSDAGETGRGNGPAAESSMDRAGNAAGAAMAPWDTGISPARGRLCGWLSWPGTGSQGNPAPAKPAWIPEAVHGPQTGSVPGAADGIMFNSMNSAIFPPGMEIAQTGSVYNRIHSHHAVNMALLY